MNTNILMILLSPDTYFWLSALAMAVLTITVYIGCRRARRRRCRLLGLVTVLLGWYVLLYGFFIGIGRLEVRQEEFASKDLPAAFDGYRIVQISDIHLGSFLGWRQQFLSRIIDSVNAQHADLIVFTGDLQNKEPQEIESFVPMLKRLKAKDGICSVCLLYRS